MIVWTSALLTAPANHPPDASGAEGTRHPARGTLAEVQDTPVRCGQVAVSLGRVDETDEELIYLSTSTPEDGRGCHVLLSPDEAAELISALAQTLAVSVASECIA